MSRAGHYLKKGISLVDSLNSEKPHSSITDWVEVLSSDRYDELSLDGIPELVESINLQGLQGTTEAARAIRKKLKYGNVHRQLRALVILRALTENAAKGFKATWANQQLLERLKEMANDPLLDPKVKKRLIAVFHAWSLQYADDPRMQSVATLYKTYAPHAAGPGVKKPTAVPASRDTAPATTTSAAAPARGGFNDDDLYNHSWEPSRGQRGPDTYADLAAARADAETRKREREARIALEQREADMERRERELRRKQEMAAIEARRERERIEEEERRRKAKEEAKSRAKQPVAKQPPRPKFDFVKEKPQIMVAIANAIQAANNLVNACRHINREVENVTESPKVQDNLDKAKAARRTIIRYIQLVTDEEFVGTLLDANEKIVESIQLYDKLSKPAALDSDSDDESIKESDVEAIQRRLQAQRLEADRTGELQQLQEAQKRESQRRQARSTRSAPTPPVAARATHPDLADLDFAAPISASAKAPAAARLPPPIRPDSDDGSYIGTTNASLSDFSDFDSYDSSDEEWRAAHGQGSQSRRTSHSAPSGSGSGARGGRSGAGASAGRSARNSVDIGRGYANLDDERQASGRLLDPNDPFGDPFADDELTTPQVEKPRMEWAAI
ncbi:hypothetical protein Q5752_006930 [Cryptotrichosporon argae]